ncbi:MAG: DUF6290 family protein [Rectinemataceae bacterium]|nr:DUF6290 family protein [Rectinemataceae bacterium]
MIAVRLPDDIENRLDTLAARTGRTKTFYVREAILEYLEELEDVYLAEKTLSEIRAGKQKTVTLDELATEYGISG